MVEQEQNFLFSEAEIKANTIAKTVVKSAVLEADGGSRGNPGVAGSGVSIVDAETGTQIFSASVFLGNDKTNNYAEYSALVVGFLAAKEIGITSLTVKMDSKLVVEQMAGRWKVSSDSIRELYRKALALAAGFKVEYFWIPRAENIIADKLANQAMDSRASSCNSELFNLDISDILAKV